MGRHRGDEFWPAAPIEECEKRKENRHCTKRSGGFPGKPPEVLTSESCPLGTALGTEARIVLCLSEAEGEAGGGGWSRRPSSWWAAG